MIDCENEVYTRIATALRAAFPGIDVTGDAVNVPSAFPHVSIEQIDNREMRGRTDAKEMIEAVFEVNVYSNAQGRKKTEAKSIAKTIDDVFTGMNFRRMSLDRTPNRDDLTIYRLTGRYEGRTDGEYFYRS